MNRFDRMCEWLEQPPRYQRWPGAQVVKCSACGSQLYRTAWPKRWHNGVAFLVFILSFDLLLPDAAPWWRGWILIWPFAFAFHALENQAYHWWWARQHPTRCQGSGHLAPAPGAA